MTHDDPAVSPELRDEERAPCPFSWEAVRREMAGLPGGGLNIAHEAVDRHAAGDAAARTALRWIARDGRAQDLSYGALRELTSRFANVLASLGTAPGERVFTLMGRIPELYVAALGTLKNRSVFCPLFAAFGPDPIRTRMTIGEARVLVTTQTLYERKVAPIRAQLPALAHVLIVARGEVDESTGSLALDRLLAQADPSFAIPPTAPEDPALLHFTSGTAGAPKGALHGHGAVLAHHATAQLVLDLRSSDVFWCTASPGWVTSTSYGIIAPLSVGATLLADEEEFDAARWYRTLAEQEVDVWYTAPTAIRMLKHLGSGLARGRSFAHLRLLASVGEALDAEAVLWGQETFGRPFHDTWWQTETGAIMIANRPGLAVKPGAMGKAVPGVEAALVRRTDGGGIVFVEQPGEEGEIALRAGWPSMFRGYLHDEERYRRCFAAGWYLTGDLARRDGDGYFWFVGRADEMIKSAGHLIGPFEVEAVLLEHPAVAEAGVVGKPDPVAGEIVKAFVALKPGHGGDEALRRELLAHARRRLGPTMAPREIEFWSRLPKNRSGKIMRRLLKAKELGLPGGDTSTLAASEDEAGSDPPPDAVRRQGESVAGR